jgi:hypothetical protein
MVLLEASIAAFSKKAEWRRMTPLKRKPIVDFVVEPRL